MKIAQASLALLLLTAIALPARAQPAGAVAAAQAPARAVVEGLVTKEPGSEPVKKALIELIAENQSIGGDYTAISGAGGTFRIEGIVPGRYRLIAERTGFIEVDRHQPRSEGRLLTLAAGQELTDVVIRLQATAAVDGRVIDEDGDPLPNAQVAVLRQTFAAGQRRWEQAAAERTNDLGEYRIAGLAPGSYYISVTPPPDFKSLIEGASRAPAANDGGQECPTRTAGNCVVSKSVVTSYTTTYYPGAKDRTQATPLQLRAGDDFPANFSLTPSPSVTIRGSVGNLPVGATAVVMLRSADFNSIMNGGEVRKDGSFEIRDVSPGTYALLATVTDTAPAAMMARQIVEVGAENISGLRLVPQLGGEIRGRVRFENKSSAGRIDASQFFLSLHSADGDDDEFNALSIGDGFSSLTHVNPDGSFAWRSVPPGHYYVLLAGNGGELPDWFVKSALASGRDATDVGLMVNGGTAAMDVLASANGAVIEGFAAGRKAGPVANASVVLVPDERFRARADRYHKTVSDQSGRFTLHGIPPGHYTLFAWESMEGDAYLNPEFLKRYEGQGTALQVSEGERKSVQLESIPGPEEQP